MILPVETATSGMPPILRNLILYSLRGVEAGFAIAIPYIAVFYAILSIFEDSGYLTRAAFLLDNLTHKLGLHGRAVIPLVLGFGCNVPAIMAVHALGTRREKRIASLLISLIPCSARTVIILGLVGTFVGFWPAVSIYVLEILIIACMGWILGKSSARSEKRLYHGNDPPQKAGTEIYPQENLDEKSGVFLYCFSASACWKCVSRSCRCPGPSFDLPGFCRACIRGLAWPSGICCNSSGFWNSSKGNGSSDPGRTCRHSQLCSCNDTCSDVPVCCNYDHLYSVCGNDCGTETRAWSKRYGFDSSFHHISGAWSGCSDPGFRAFFASFPFNLSLFHSRFLLSLFSFLSRRNDLENKIVKSIQES